MKLLGGVGRGPRISRLHSGGSLDLGSRVPSKVPESGSIFLLSSVVISLSVDDFSNYYSVAQQ